MVVIALRVFFDDGPSALLEAERVALTREGDLIAYHWVDGECREFTARRGSFTYFVAEARS